jgi:lipopolysaccharide export system protein LptA
MWDTRSGPVFATETADGGGPAHRVNIRFAGEVNIAFAQEEAGPTIDGESGAKSESRRQYLEKAVFLGDVLMQQGDDSIAGERIQIDFGPPRREGSLADNMRRLRGEGQVALVQGNESVRCERIDVEMGLDESGRIAPRLARAYSDVSATHEGRTITASDRMIVHLRSFRQQREPFDLNKARAVAMARGHDPDTVDWDEVRADYESKASFRAGLDRLEAYEDVAVRDPEQNLRVDAGTLSCTFRGGREIDRALVNGTPTAPAHVELDDFSISGGEVDLDVASESAQVPGAGRLTFLSTRDLDGRESDEPVPVAITWSERMTYRGSQNRAILTGSVHAATEESIVDCGELIVDFSDPEDGQAAADSAEAGGRDAVQDDWWIFTPLAERLRGKRKERDSGLLGRRFDKEPVYILASGSAVAQTTKTELETGRILSRGRIEGPKILVDLRSEVMTIEDPGNLLIEDYEVPASLKERRPEQRSPFGGLGVGSPSQTFVTWTGQMAYYFGQQAAFFEEGVEMVHRSGTEILLGREAVGDTSHSVVTEASDQQGRNATLTCRELVIKFSETEDSSLRSRRRGAGRMSAYELSLFQATGGAHFEDGGVVVLAHSVSYDAVRNWLTVRGDENSQAAIYDQRGGRFRDLAADVIDWDRNTDRIYAPNARVIGR